MTTPGSNVDVQRPYVASPVELLSLVTNRTSKFTVDITVDRFDGGQYAPGEVFTIRYTSARPGYLYLFYLDSQGNLAVLFPLAGADNRISDQGRFTLPPAGAGFVFKTADAPGTHRVKAVVTSVPLAFSGLSHNSGSPERARQMQQFHLPPSQKVMLKSILGRYQRFQPIDASHLGSASPHEFLGPFGQDEVAFYVGP
jgi:hypothetical protein